MRVKTWLALSTAVLAGALILPGALSAASASASNRPYFIEWRPGTPLPRTLQGMRLLAEPPSSVLARIKPGGKMPMTTPARATANSAGIVNLVEEPAYCAPAFVKKKYPKRLTYVGQSYMTAKHIKVEFAYSKTASSSLGVGVSATGAYGSFSASGSVSESTTATQGMPTKWGVSYNWYQTDFDYEEWEQACDGGIYYYWVQAYQWDAGARIQPVKHAPVARDCVPEPKGSYYGETATKAQSFDVAFTLPAVGFSGSGDTGWTKQASITYWWYVNGSDCGTNHSPPRAAAMVAK
jgi:hypothetical protein